MRLSCGLWNRLGVQMSQPAGDMFWREKDPAAGRIHEDENAGWSLFLCPRDLFRRDAVSLGKIVCCALPWFRTIDQNCLARDKPRKQRWTL